jgi:hypothetical protein
MAAHQVATPKHKRDSTDLKITLPARPAAPAPFEAVQSDFADLADEMAVDPLSSESEDTLFPPLSVLLENPPAKAAKNPHKPKKAKKSSNRCGDKDVNSDGLETRMGNLTASDDSALPVKKSCKHAKARPPVDVPKPEDLSEHIPN